MVEDMADLLVVLVWCKRGWDKNALNVTFYDVFLIGHKHATLHLSDA
jgi:hypothetical protein